MIKTSNYEDEVTDIAIRSNTYKESRKIRGSPRNQDINTEPIKNQLKVTEPPPSTRTEPPRNQPESPVDDSHV